MTLTNAILTGGVPQACPICGSWVVDTQTLFARCRKCGSEATVLNLLEVTAGDR